MYKKKRVLVAEDETVIRNVIKEALSSEGYFVETVPNGSEAIDKIKVEKYDLVIMDNKMPMVEGIEVLRFIHTSKYPAVSILMTAYGSIDHAVEAMKLGAFDYITKPFKVDDLIEKVGFALKNKEKISYETNEESTLLRGNSPQIGRIKDIIQRVKNTRVTVLITGESGTGKGVVAREIHNSGTQRNEPFIHVNCAVLPENLIESELFGHVKGAFTGATDNKTGKFEAAGEGTIFLDEIGLLGHSLQAKLLTVIQEREFQKIGSNKTMKMKARVIAATNENLKKQVENGKFRKDLYYRLNVVSINCLPLKKRKEDIELLSQYFIKKFNEMYARDIRGIEKDAIDLLMKYDWPGNVRELENFVERTVAMTTSDMISLNDIEALNLIEFEEESESRFEGNLEKQEFFTIVEALKRNDGHREKTAKDLGISRRTLQYKLKKYNLN